ncbi:hypothetical protein BHE90_014732 [Fusarium euwallaceae]|uniref:CYTH domain-containing protein n=1 Tax=Fusarium euwallaceae TaxID=1147111 RepID=A0A430L552_9HYPO|nr:hypothetical protein BHE90_014732 [Fusarium euwallaceae]
MKFYTLFACILLTSRSLSQTPDNETHLQWSICDRDPETVLKKLGDDIRPPYKRNPITYFDTLPPSHAQQGVMFRTKINKGSPFSVIKVRFNEKPLYTPPMAECVWDRYGDRVLYTCGERYSLTGEKRRIWSDEQVRFAETYHEINWDGLVPYGPFPDGKWKLKILGRKAKLDDVQAGTLHLMEIEMSVYEDEAEYMYRMVTEHLVGLGVVLCNPQSPKTLRLFHEMGYLGDEVEEEL